MKRQNNSLKMGKERNTTKKSPKEIFGWVWWFMSRFIPAIWEVKKGQFQFKSSLGKAKR
jgi:hypothetical protein